VCCGVLQCIAACCTCSVVNDEGISCHAKVLQCVAVYYSALQCVAVCCSIVNHEGVSEHAEEAQSVAGCCSVLHCVAVCCIVLIRNSAPHC